MLLEEYINWNKLGLNDIYLYIMIIFNDYMLKLMLYNDMILYYVYYVFI